MSDLTRFIGRPCGWLDSPGEHNGIVISSRIRLARNLATYPFQRKMSRARQQELVTHLTSTLGRTISWPDAMTLMMTELNDIERQALTERQLVSRDLAAGKRPSGVYISDTETYSLMLNEEDHVRMQVISAGLAIKANLKLARTVDQTLERYVDWAVHPKFGYLSACPTNAGTGLRASVMLHLPALAETQDLRQVLRGLTKLHMTVRGLHGEGSEATGHYYQISNQRSLGVSEDEIVSQIGETVEKIISYEQLARQALLDNSRWRVEDRIFRGWAILTHARSISNDELTDQLSWVRMGTALGLIHADWKVLDRIFLQCQPAHLQLQHANAGTPEVRDRLRADLVRQWLSS